MGRSNAGSLAAKKRTGAAAVGVGALCMLMVGLNVQIASFLVWRELSQGGLMTWVVGIVLAFLWKKGRIDFLEALSGAWACGFFLGCAVCLVTLWLNAAAAPELAKYCDSMASYHGSIHKSANADNWMDPEGLMGIIWQFRTMFFNIVADYESAVSNPTDILYIVTFLPMYVVKGGFAIFCIYIFLSYPVIGVLEVIEWLLEKKRSKTEKSDD